MTRLIPVLIAVVAIGILTFVEGQLSERWGDSRHCAYCATLLDNVPSEIGDWVGVDSEVVEEVQVTAGARGYVSRSYRNSSTGEVVSIWFIVGHARDTARHTPVICYPSNGFKYDTRDNHQITLDNGQTATFLTALFTKRNSYNAPQERVYWTWFRPVLESNGPVEWIAPKNVRMEVAAAPALYKLYFTTVGPAALAEHDESVCLRFAREFFAAVDPILEPANGSIPEGFDASVKPAI